MAEGKAHAFVERSGARIDGGRGIPEVAQEFHLAGVVPDVDAKAVFTRANHPIIAQLR